MPLSTVVRLLSAPAIVFSVALLAACGGGGGSPAASSDASIAVPSVAEATPATEPSRLNVYKSGSATSVAIEVDGDAFNMDGVRYALQSGAAGCSLAATPPDPGLATCSPLPGSAGFLACDASSDASFHLLLLQDSRVRRITWEEMDGRTLAAASCGPGGLREIPGSTVRFDGYPGSAVETHVQPGLMTQNTYDSNVLLALFGAQGGVGDSTAFVRRWALYKTTTGTSTHYFLVDLQAPQAGIPNVPPAPKLYTLQVP